VRIDGKLIREKREQSIYLAFNKPVGNECTTNLEVRGNVDYINYPAIFSYRSFRQSI
jgi:23S rRNA pseudouridine2604 synthase